MVCGSFRVVGQHNRRRPSSHFSCSYYFRTTVHPAVGSIELLPRIAAPTIAASSNTTIAVPIPIAHNPACGLPVTYKHRPPNSDAAPTVNTNGRHCETDWGPAAILSLPSGCLRRIVMMLPSTVKARRTTKMLVAVTTSSKSSPMRNDNPTITQCPVTAVISALAKSASEKSTGPRVSFVTNINLTPLTPQNRRSEQVSKANRCEAGAQHSGATSRRRYGCAKESKRNHREPTRPCDGQTRSERK